MDTPVDGERIFADWAPRYADCGLVTFPVGGENGKVPLVKHWQKFEIRTYTSLAAKFATANVAVRDGDQHGITRVDIDDPALVPGAIEAYGDTPLKVRTPRGGTHLYYRAHGEARVLGVNGQKIDILGRGGFGVVPPSVCPLTGRRWEFIEGNLDDLRRLPTLRGGDWAPSVPDMASHSAPAAMREGDGRNRALFNHLRGRARDAASFDELMAEANAYNAGFGEPLPAAEVTKIVGSVWRYKVEDRLLVPGRAATTFITQLESEEFRGNSVALQMLIRLRIAHGARIGPFALANAMAPALGISLRAFRKARAFLEVQGFIACVRPGGRGEHDPPLYVLLRR